MCTDQEYHKNANRINTVLQRPIHYGNPLFIDTSAINYPSYSNCEWYFIVVDAAQGIQSQQKF